MYELGIKSTCRRRSALIAHVFKVRQSETTNCSNETAKPLIYSNFEFQIHFEILLQVCALKKTVQCTYYSTLYSELVVEM